MFTVMIMTLFAPFLSAYKVVGGLIYGRMTLEEAYEYIKSNIENKDIIGAIKEDIELIKFWLGIL